jgi:hypothetical protein
MKKKFLHRGIHFHRVTSGYDPREEVFAEEWERECQPNRGTNLGRGILQDLMWIDSKTSKRSWFRGLARHGYWAFWIRRRDAAIVATVIQWLGSNCGICFLEQCLKRIGYRLAPINGEVVRRGDEMQPPEAEIAVKISGKCCECDRQTEQLARNDYRNGRIVFWCGCGKSFKYRPVSKDEALRVSWNQLGDFADGKGNRK